LFKIYFVLELSSAYDAPEVQVSSRAGLELAEICQELFEDAEIFPKICERKPLCIQKRIKIIKLKK
jgi:hypothetical protein